MLTAAARRDVAGLAPVTDPITDQWAHRLYAATWALTPRPEADNAPAPASADPHAHARAQTGLARRIVDALRGGGCQIESTDLGSVTVTLPLKEPPGPFKRWQEGIQSIAYVSLRCTSTDHEKKIHSLVLVSHRQESGYRVANVVTLGQVRTNYMTLFRRLRAAQGAARNPRTLANLQNCGARTCPPRNGKPRPRSRRSHVVIRPPTVRGGVIDKLAVTRTLRRRLSAFRRCHTIELSRGQTAPQKLTVRWRVTATGQAMHVHARAHPHKVSTLTNCVTMLIRRMRFPPLTTGTFAMLEVQINFTIR